MNILSGKTEKWKIYKMTEINELFEKATNGEEMKKDFERYQIEQEIKDLGEGEK